MKELIKKQEEKFEGNIHAILAGLLLNGFIQGSGNEKLNDNTLDFAKKELNKVISKVRKETLEFERNKIRRNIGQLRQYLNERKANGLITTEELETFLIT